MNDKRVTKKYEAAIQELVRLLERAFPGRVVNSRTATLRTSEATQHCVQLDTLFTIQTKVCFSLDLQFDVITDALSVMHVHENCTRGRGSWRVVIERTCCLEVPNL